MKKVNSPNCDKCVIVDNIIHNLTEFNKFKIEREEWMQKYEVNKYDVIFYLSRLAQSILAVTKYLINICLHQ